MKIIDCTIRDGGLLNNWNFEDRVVKASCFAAEKSGVDYFEIGYKNDLLKDGLGPYGYCENNFINSLFKKKPNIKLLCMIDANKYTNYEISNYKDKKNPFSGIRIASYPDDVERSVELIEKVHELGYEVFLQLMSSSEWKEGQYKVLKNWKNKNILEAIYFADSFGSFLPEDIKKYINNLKELGFDKIGFHSHNSLQMAFANSLQAMDSGASYIDASIYGMGRGSGNLPIEILLSYLYKNGESKYNVVPYLDVIERFYVDLMKQYNWGFSLKSLFGGIRNIHPYYIEELFKQGFYTADEIWNLLDNIKQDCPISFSKNELQGVLKNRFHTPTALEAKEIIQEVTKQTKIFPSEDAILLENLKIKDLYKNSKFLIIANGPSIDKYSKEINEFIKKNNLVSIGCNYIKSIYKPNYHLFVNKKRFLKYASTISSDSELIVPSFFGNKIVRENYDGLLEYIEIVSSNDLNSKPIQGIKQQHVYLNVAIAAILTAYQMGAVEIMVVGMDGYESGNPKEMIYFYNEDNIKDDQITASIRYDNLMAELQRVNDFLNENGVSFSIITPTSHKKYFKNTLNLINLN